MNNFAKTLAVFAFAATLCCGMLAGCTSGSAGNGGANGNASGNATASLPDYAQEFVGVWQIELQDTDQESTLAPRAVVDYLRAFKGDVALQLSEDCTARLMMVDVVYEGTWSASAGDQGTGTLKLTVYDATTTLDLTFEESTLKAGNDNEGYMYFKRVDADKEASVIAAATGQNLDELDTTDLQQRMDIVLADDDVCKIVVLGKGSSSDGTPGYEIEVTNRTDNDLDLYVNPTTEPTVNGEACPTVFLTMQIVPGDTTRGFMYFDFELEGVGDLESATGLISVQNPDYEVLGDYPYNL